MSQAIEESRRTILALTNSVSSAGARYRLREIYERLTVLANAPRGQGAAPTTDPRQA